MRVQVIGAGLSGLAAAFELARSGVPVTLSERRGFAGGRAYSFDGPDGEELDNGQHVFLECCTGYRQFVRDVGADHLIELQPRAKVPFIDGRTGRASWLTESFLLPAPLHFFGSFVRFKALSWRDRVAVMKCGREMLQADWRAFDDVSMGRWLRDHGQSSDAIRHFWNLALVSILNEHADRVSAAAGLFIFQHGFLRSKSAARVGYARAGLGRIAHAAVEAIRKAGGEVRFHEKVERLEGYDCYIPAVPSRALLDLLAPEQRELEFFRRAEDLPTSPIVNVHVRFDRPVWTRPFAAFVASPLQWVFNRTRLYGRDGATRLTACFSGARELMEATNGEIERLCVDELRRLLPDARGAIVKRVTVVREPEATFVAAPGARAKRLPCETPLPNVFLAGEWTESDWPSTMEAAVRNGIRAAQRALRAVK